MHRRAGRPRVIQITDLRAVPEEEILRRLPADEGGGYWVQLRDRHLPGRALWSWGLRLRAATEARGIPLLVNDRLDLAVALDADGVHLGRTSVAAQEARSALGEDARITRSVHDDEELGRAVAEGVDAVLLSPIFDSPGKAPGRGVAALGHARASLPPEVALIALGGVDADRALDCFAAGADGVASIRADLTSCLSGARG